MIALLQRVNSANVIVDGDEIARIGQGLLVLLAVEKNETAARVERMIERIMGYRVFEDEQGRMNLSLMDIDGDLLMVPQFTLAADTNKGMRPSFTSAAAPDEGRHWFRYALDVCQQKSKKVQAGRFGADMKVGLVNDGPVTFWLQV
ncbi:MAG: D-aminoacyl-tRNA deacylase [Gammaproteobacteria bacterium]|nr:D-aminoacyl-tRNA deacylase [Gammaproteobacteria bacterium]